MSYACGGCGGLGAAEDRGSWPVATVQALLFRAGYPIGAMSPTGTWNAASRLSLESAMGRPANSLATSGEIQVAGQEGQQRIEMPTAWFTRLHQLPQGGGSTQTPDLQTQTEPLRPSFPVLAGLGLAVTLGGVAWFAWRAGQRRQVARNRRSSRLR